MPTISRAPDDQPPLAPVVSAEGGKPDNIPTGTLASDAQPTDYGEDIDLSYWIQCMDDAERAESDWRRRGREVVEIYRNDKSAGRKRGSKSPETVFNVLYANTEVMLGAVYQKPPTPVVRSRFTAVKPVPMLPQPPQAPMIGAPMPGAPPELGGGAPSPSMPPAGAPVPTPLLPTPPTPLPPAAGGMDTVAPGLGAPPIDLAAPPIPGPSSPPIGLVPGAPTGLPAVGLLGSSPDTPPSPVGAPGGLPSLAPPPGDEAADIETAAAVIEKALEIVVDDEHSHEAIKTAIKDVLLPGRGTCRVRWNPVMKTVPVMAADGMTPLPAGGMPGAEPATKQVKVWETVEDEYVFWEDILLDPVRQMRDCDWLAFRHLFSGPALQQEFAGNPKFDALVAAGKLGDLLVWTDETAAKHMVGGGSAPKTAGKLGNHRRKAMVWEVWDRLTRKIIWLIRDGAGLVLRVDPDSMQLTGFYPCPIPMLAVTTSDSRIPRTYYDLYARLAEDLDVISDRISKLQAKIKVRGAYNSSSREIADILTADDGKMLPVAGVDMLNGGLQNHIWLLPIEQWVAALQQLYVAQDEIKNAIYEIMGISDIMRGATKASETATAQRIKGSMGVSRLEDMKGIASNFVRDMLRLKAEIICKNFDAATLSKMTGEDVTPSVEAILKDDFERTCAIDIEADSTVVPDEQAEQEGMTQTVMAIGTIMNGAMQMMQSQILPAPMVLQLSLELLKMALHPIRFSRPVVELINGYQKQLEQIIAVGGALGPPPPAPPAPGIGHNGGPPMPQEGKARAPSPAQGRSGGNGASKPPIPGGPPGPPQLPA